MRKIALFFLLFLQIACNKEMEKKDPNTSDQHLRLCILSDPVTLDVRRSGDLLTSALGFMLFQGLCELRANGKVELALAKSYELSKDQKTYTFHLKDALWSDQTPISAYDFESSWKKVIDPNFPSLCTHLFYVIKNVEKICKKQLPINHAGFYAKDTKTFVVELENPCPYFLELLSFCAFFPVASHKNDASFSSDKNFVCSGPFMLKTWDHNNRLIVEKNLNFWDQKRVHLNQVEMFVVPDEMTSLHMFEKSQVDFLGTPFSSFPIEALSSLTKQQLQLIPIAGVRFCSFNTQSSPFNNRHMRLAFSLAIDRAKIVENVTQQKEQKATRFIPPSLMNQQNKKLFEDHNEALAKYHLKIALKELKISKKDLCITFNYGAQKLQKTLAQVLQKQWQSCLGIKVRLEQLEPKLHLEKLHNHNYQIALAYLSAQYNDPLNVLERFKNKDLAKNYPQWENEEYISLLSQTLTITDAKTRANFLEKAEEILCYEVPLTPIFHCSYASLAKPHLKNAFIGPLGDLHLDELFIQRL